MSRPRSSKAVVPDVKGLHVDNAIVTLRNAGFTRHRVVYDEGYEAENTVMAQLPLKGQLALLQDEVTLRVSKRSILRFLPSIYQQPSSENDPGYLRRFLYIFQHIQESVLANVERAQRNFNVLEADPDVLPWLAQWVAFPMDPDWSPERRRKMLRSVAELYKIRGTKQALVRMLDVFTGVRPEIEENAWPFKGFRIGVTSRTSIDTVILPTMNLAHSFIVHFPKSYDDIGEGTAHKIHEIIRMEKPAHTVYYVHFAPPKPVAEVEAETPGDAVLRVTGRPGAALPVGGGLPDESLPGLPSIPKRGPGEAPDFDMPRAPGSPELPTGGPEDDDAAKRRGPWHGIGVKAAATTHLDESGAAVRGPEEGAAEVAPDDDGLLIPAPVGAPGGAAGEADAEATAEPGATEPEAAPPATAPAAPESGPGAGSAETAAGAAAKDATAGDAGEPPAAPNEDVPQQSE